MTEQDETIGPTFNQFRTPVVPKGPTGDLSALKGSRGMQAAKRLFAQDGQTIEGTRLETPLSLGTPIFEVKPSSVSTPEVSKKEPPVAKPQDTASEPKLVKPDSQVILGNTHVDSYQTLLANDRMAKPVIKAWSDD